MKRQKINHCGSAVIEMTLLIPVFLGCIYFYIMLFLYLVQTTKQFYFLAENLYETESVTASGEGIEKTVKGKKETVGCMEEGCNYLLKQRGISRMHAKLMKKTDGLYLLDLNSTNGTFLNGEAIVSGEEYKLDEGDVVAFAQCEFYVARIIL